jgi:hypothetical protein
MSSGVAVPASMRATRRWVKADGRRKGIQDGIIGFRVWCSSDTREEETVGVATDARGSLPAPDAALVWVIVRSYDSRTADGHLEEVTASTVIIARADRNPYAAHGFPSRRQFCYVVFCPVERWLTDGLTALGRLH